MQNTMVANPGQEALALKGVTGVSTNSNSITNPSDKDAEFPNAI